jgi:hypothetical protein
MHGILGRDALQCRSDCLDEILVGSSFRAAQEAFNFAPHLLNGVEVRGVSRQKEDLGTCLGDQQESRITLMWGKVVHDDHIAFSERRAEHPAHVFAEDLRIGGALNGHAGGGTIETDRGDHGGRVPVSLGALGMDPLAPGSTAAQPGHVGLCARLVDKDQPRGIEAPLPPPPCPARPRDVRAVLLARAERLFFKVSPIFPKK